MSFTVYADPALFLHAPNFPAIREENYVEHIKQAIEIARERFLAIKNNPDKPTYANTIDALENCDIELEKILAVFYTLLSAESTDAMQEMAQEIGPLTSAFSNDIGLDSDIFKRIDDLWNRVDKLDLTDHQKVVLENIWIGFKRNGAKLNETDKEKLRALDARLSVLTPQFSDNSRKSANAFKLIITDKKDLAGLPDTAITAAKETAEEKGEKNAWVFTLDHPSYVPFVTYADNRSLREKIWRASSSRAFNDQYDNQKIILEKVALRHERSQLLGYDTYADYALERRMAEGKEAVIDFLDKLEKSARPSAERDLQKLRDFAAKQGVKEELKPWDVAYWSEKLKKAEYDFDEEELRPYFMLDNVMDGVFTHAEKLFGIVLKPLDSIPVYADDVRTYRVEDKDGTLRGLLYADFHPRKGKRQGAWQGTIRDRDTSVDGIVELPLVNIVMNFTKPTKDTPSLLTLNEVETLFHEFGHALHSLLTDIDHGAISGTSVFWDFVELPSQLMENWLGESETLNLFAKHYETGKAIPAAMIKKLKASKNFMKGWQLMRQLAFCKLDMAWHSHYKPSEITDVVDFEQSILKPYALLPYEGGCMSTSFGHIFAGGYAAGYYSYLWAQVLDADAFEAFLENGLYDERTGKKFRSEILAKGGSAHPMTLYKNFRGREPDPDALLRRDGLIEEPRKIA